VAESDHDALVRLGVLIQALTDKITEHLVRTNEHGERLRNAESTISVMQSQLNALSARHYGWPTVLMAFGSVVAIVVFIGDKLG
jgi:hypothetical protein